MSAIHQRISEYLRDDVVYGIEKVRDKFEDKADDAIKKIPGIKWDEVDKDEYQKVIKSLAKIVITHEDSIKPSFLF